MEEKIQRRRERLVPAAVFLIALAVRLAHVAAIRHLPSFDHPYAGLDADLYTRLARAIAGGEFFPRGIIDAAPLYAYWLGAIMRIAGDSPLVPRLAQALLGAFAAALLERVASDAAGRKAGALTGFAAALYPPFVLAEGTLQSTALVPILGALLLVGARRARRSAPAAVAAGIAAGTMLLARPDLLPLVLVLPAWLVFSPAGRKGAALAAAGVLLVASPFSVASSISAGGFVPVTAHGGIHFYLGNHEGADGTLAPALGIAATPEGFARDARSVARREAGRDLSPAEVSRFWFREGLGALARDPVRAAALFLRKAYLFVNDYEIPNNEDLYFLRRYSPPLRIPFPLFGVVFAFGVYGLLFGKFREGDRALLGLSALAVFAVAVLFFVTGRYRLAAVPPLLVLAGGGAAAWGSHIRTKRLVAAAVVPLLVLAHAPERRFDFAAPETRLGDSYLQAGDDESAESAFREALATHPDFAEAKRGLARALSARGDAEGAERIYREMAGGGWDDRTARNDLATFLAGEGKTDEAAGILQALLAEDPDDAVALGNLGAVRLQEGKDVEAGDLLMRAIRVDPERGGPYLNLAMLRTREGKLDEAIPLYRRHLALDPSSERGLFNLGTAYAMANDWESAIRVWEELRGRNPNYPRLGASLSRARLLLRENRR